MVDSIKYWCVQTGLLEDDGGSGNMKLTGFAKDGLTDFVRRYLTGKSRLEIHRAALLACLWELEERS